MEPGPRECAARQTHGDTLTHRLHPVAATALILLVLSSTGGTAVADEHDPAGCGPGADCAAPVAPEARGSERTTGALERGLDYAAIGFDAVVVRPLSLAAVAVGAPFFLVTAPFAALQGDLGTAYEVFVKSPVAYAWSRPLGEL